MSVTQDMETHRLAHENQELWRSLRIGQEILVVKLSPDGDEATRYPATLVECAQEDGWVALRATWTYQRVDIDGLLFEPGDELIEWFSPVMPFNAFAVYNPEFELRGWYANVTYPAYLEPGTTSGDPPNLFWRDLYLDLVGLPDDSYVIRDEDELAESGLEVDDPRLHREVLAASDDLTRRFTSHQLPFRTTGAPVSTEVDPRQSHNESD